MTAHPVAVDTADDARTKVMGVVNVTADSFSDGGRYLDAERAVEHGFRLLAGGADIIDVGGESTRPGAVRVDESVEIKRVVPVIAALAAEGAQVSVDTMRAGVASAAIEAGATIVNDVSGGRADPGMAALLADAGLPWILMHWRPAAAESDAGRRFTHRVDDTGGYRDVVAEVSRELLGQVDAAVDVGVDPDNIILDPGWDSPRQHNTIGRCSTRCRRWSISVFRCSSGRRASVSSARCSPPTATIVNRRDARSRRRRSARSPRCRARGEFGSTTSRPTGMR